MGPIKATTLADLLDNLDDLDDEATIYAAAEPCWNESSLAIATMVAPTGPGLPVEATGMKYFLEVFIAKEVWEVWPDGREGRVPTKKDKYEAIIYYAENDAYLPID